LIDFQNNYGSLESNKTATLLYQLCILGKLLPYSTGNAAYALGSYYHYVYIAIICHEFSQVVDHLVIVIALQARVLLQQNEQIVKDFFSLLPLLCFLKTTITTASKYTTLPTDFTGHSQAYA
jgi:hypothetical protein